jgi:hypothetical protein
MSTCLIVFLSACQIVCLSACLSVLLNACIFVLFLCFFRCRRALQHVLMHTKHRKSFGLPLIDHPLMQNLTADLCLEAEAQTLTALYFSAIFDAAHHNYVLPTHLPDRFANSDSGDTDMMELFRIGVAVGKYWVTKRHPGFAYECMEAFGGNGFVEDFPMAMLYRQSPLNSIWEGEQFKSRLLNDIIFLRPLYALPRCDHSARASCISLLFAFRFWKYHCSGYSKSPIFLSRSAERHQVGVWVQQRV